MKETGIIRHLDDLGRIVIPKEIRKKLKIQNGDMVEIFTDGDTVILKKYNPLSLDILPIKAFINALKHEYHSDVIICDKNRVIYSTVSDIQEGSSLKDEFVSKVDNLVDKELTKHISLEITDGKILGQNAYISKIYGNYEDYGYVIVLDAYIKKREIELSNIIIGFLSEILRFE